MKMKAVIVRVRDKVNSVLKDISGATLIEYAVLLGVVLAVAVGAILVVGQKVNNTFSIVRSSLPN